MNSLKSPTLTSQTNSVASLIPALDRWEQPTSGQKQAIAQIYLKQANLYYHEHDWQQALIACKNALKIAPKTVEVYQILGDILYRQGKQAKALGIYAQALTLDPNCAAIYTSLGNLFTEQENWQQALDYYQQAVAIAPDLAPAYLGLARVWEELEDAEKALECFCHAVNLDPRILPSEAYFNFGRELSQQGKLKEASILLIQGLKSNPDAESELTLLVAILEDLEEWQQAVIYYHQLISLPNQSQEQDSIADQSKPIKKLLSHSQSLSHSTVQSIIAKNTAQEIPSLLPEIALKLLPKAQSTKNQAPVKAIAPEELQSDSPLSWNNLGSSYAQQQQWNKAISCYQEALQLDPNFAKSYRNLARVYKNIGEELKAAHCWYNAFTLEPEQVTPEAFHQLAEKLLEYQDQDKAIACLRQTIKLNPSFSPAYLLLAQLLESKGKLPEAEACYAQLINQDGGIEQKQQKETEGLKTNTQSL